MNTVTQIIPMSNQHLTDVQESGLPHWSVAIFSARENSDVLTRAISAILSACVGKATVIDVIINGNQDLADAINRKKSELLAASAAIADLNVWYIPMGDKANAWNQYVYRVRPESELVFFIDGYVEVFPDALAAIASGIASSPHYLAATGVPSFGRSATKLRKQMLRNGGIHGNLYALKRDALRRVRECGFKLPLHIYRTDPTMGAALAFNLDPKNNAYDRSRIWVEPKASWSYTPLSIFSYSHLLTHFRRILRQAQGALELQAVRNHFAVKKMAPGALPATTRELIESWLLTASWWDKRILIKKPVCLYALHKLRQQAPQTQPDADPKLLT